MKIIKFLQESFKTKKKGHEENYIFNLNIDSDNQIGFLLQATEL